MLPPQVPSPNMSNNQKVAVATMGVAKDVQVCTKEKTLKA